MKGGDDERESFCKSRAPWYREHPCKRSRQDTWGLPTSSYRRRMFKGFHRLVDETHRQQHLLMTRGRDSTGFENSARVPPSSSRLHPSRAPDLTKRQVHIHCLRIWQLCTGGDNKGHAGR